MKLFKSIKISSSGNLLLSSFPIVLITTALIGLISLEQHSTLSITKESVKALSEQRRKLSLAADNLTNSETKCDFNQRIVTSCNHEYSDTIPPWINWKKLLKYKKNCLNPCTLDLLEENESFFESDIYIKELVVKNDFTLLSASGNIKIDRVSSCCGNDPAKHIAIVTSKDITVSELNLEDGSSITLISTQGSVEVTGSNYMSAIKVLAKNRSKFPRNLPKLELKEALKGVPYIIGPKTLVIK